jgi:hypothetical protein
MVAKSVNLVTTGVFATTIGLSAMMLLSRDAAADVSVPCTGDAAACKYLKLDQKGTDYKSGAHFILSFTLPSGHVRQSMSVTLSIAPSKDDCSKSPRDTLANVEPGSPRSIDGYLCKLRATLERR